MEDIEKLIVNLAEFRQQTAQQVLCKLFDRFDDLFDSYLQRPKEKEDYSIEQYAANVAVAYTYALIDSLGIVQDVTDSDNEGAE